MGSPTIPTCFWGHGVAAHFQPLTHKFTLIENGLIYYNILTNTQRIIFNLI